MIVIQTDHIQKFNLIQKFRATIRKRMQMPKADINFMPWTLKDWHPLFGSARCGGGNSFSSTFALPAIHFAFYCRLTHSKKFTGSFFAMFPHFISFEYRNIFIYQWIKQFSATSWLISKFLLTPQCHRECKTLIDHVSSLVRILTT